MQLVHKLCNLFQQLQVSQVKAGQALAKFPLLSKVGAKPIANVLSDTMLDLGLDTLPSTVSRYSIW